LDRAYHVSGIVFDNAEFDFDFVFVHDTDDVSVVGEGGAFDLFFEEGFDGWFEAGSEVDWFEYYFAFEGFDVEHYIILVCGVLKRGLIGERCVKGVNGVVFVAVVVVAVGSGIV